MDQIPMLVKEITWLGDDFLAGSPGPQGAKSRGRKGPLQTHYPYCIARYEIGCSREPQ